MLFVLGPRRDSCHADEGGNRQHRNTHLHAKRHSSSSAWLGGTSLRTAWLGDKKLLWKSSRQRRAAAYRSLRGQRFLVFGEIHGLPLTLDDRSANLRGGLSLAQLLVSVEVFADADVASGAVLAREAIEQAAVSLAAVAMAVAWLLVEGFLDSRRNRVGILHHRIAEELRIHGRGKRPRRTLRVKCRHGLFGPGLRHAHAFRRTRSRAFGQKYERQRETRKSCTAQQFSASKHR